jgi:hypothetical protein
MRFLDVQENAVGIIAIGGNATGVIAIGGAATGVVAIGGYARGIFAVGGFAIGVWSLGGFCLGMVASAGGLSLGGRQLQKVLPALYLIPNLVKRVDPPTLSTLDEIQTSNSRGYVRAKLSTTGTHHQPVLSDDTGVLPIKIPCDWLYKLRPKPISSTVDVFAEVEWLHDVFVCRRLIRDSYESAWAKISRWATHLTLSTIAFSFLCGLVWWAAVLPALTGIKHVMSNGHFPVFLPL